MKTTNKSRSVNLHMAALPLSVLDAPRRNKAGQRVSTAWRRDHLVGDDAESMFLAAVEGYDAASVDDLRKIACFYGDLLIVSYLVMVADEIGDVTTTALIRRAARGIGVRAGMCPDEFLRAVLVLLFNAAPLEVDDLMTACREYGRARSGETVGRIRETLSPLRATPTGVTSLHVLGVSTSSMTVSAKRAGVSTANISQRASRIRERVKRWVTS